MYFLEFRIRIFISKPISFFPGRWPLGRVLLADGGIFLISILYVGDDPDIPKILTGVIQEEHNIAVDTIPDTQKALECVSAGRYQVVFADHEPPAIDALQLVRELRKKGMYIPFVLSCTRKDEALAKEAYCSGVDFFMEEADEESKTSILRAIILREIHGDFLSRREERVKIALETNGLIVWEWEPATEDLTPVIVIPEIFGYQGSQIEDAGTRYRGYIHPEDLEGFKEAYLAHVKERSPHFTVDARIQGKDGSWKWMNVHGKVIERNEVGIPVRVIGTLHDGTEMRKYRDGIKAANEKLNLLGSITRHDILNQIMVVLGYLTLLEEMLPLDSEMREYCLQATKATKQIRRQINFTRDYQDLGVRAPEWQRVEDVVRLAGDVVSPGISLRIMTGSLEIFADPLLEKVFSNLFDNSLRHGGHVTEISVSFREEGDEGILMVEDNGEGIPDEDKNRVFERGFGRNTGFGLFLVKEILDITGLGIREKGIPGEGARFEITIPTRAFRNHE
jgi:PAS domain S-box-containing protein